MPPEPVVVVVVAAVAAALVLLLLWAMGAGNGRQVTARGWRGGGWCCDTATLQVRFLLLLPPPLWVLIWAGDGRRAASDGVVGVVVGGVATRLCYRAVGAVCT